uniref:NADH-ubiquinone oxidoreductase chain 5 n=1 Tax=Silax daleus TaxID=3230861 RepID=A0AAU8HN47_9ECHI
MILISTIFISFITFLIISFFSENNSKGSLANWLLALSSSLAGISCIIWIVLDCPSFIVTIQWFNPQLQEFNISFFIDNYFIVFGSIALFVTWSIVEFSYFYMSSDPNKQAFLNTLILFLLFMLLLVSSNSLFLLFIGWEGVGIMSFVLIGWWFTRSDANSSALQAIIYNRIGDTGMILFLIFSILQVDSWNLNDILFLNISSPLSNWAILGIILAATGKSAQFSLHPWLPSAMEGPTPVSALLHSSTMVVAGVFLLIRCFPVLSYSSWALYSIALLGSITSLFAASVALTQFDIKKIVAYSTTSQLGLMVVSVGIGLPWLALFHICTHAFFKALLFLCSGSIIHALNNEQDLRKMGNSNSALPFTSSALFIGSAALCGLPFLAGYYSKDLILEAAQNSITNSLSIILALLATLITAIYSARIIFFLSSINNSNLTVVPVSEENLNLINPLLRLLLGIFLTGLWLSLTFFHFHLLIIPWINKSLPLILTILAVILIFSTTQAYSVNSYNQPISFYLNNSWFFVQINHSNLFLSSIRSSIQGVLRNLDQGWTALIGPSGSSIFFSTLTTFIHKAQSGLLTHYLSYGILLILLFILLLWL